MNVLVVISSAGIYGAESMVLNLLQALASLGCRPVLAALWNSHHPNPQLPDLARKRGLEVEIVQCQGRFDVSVARQLKQFIRKYQIDVVHSHGYKADTYTYLATRRPAVPLVATCHNWTDLTPSIRFYGWLDRLVLRRFDRIAAVSEAVAKILTESGVSARKLALVPNGVPTDRFDSTGGGRIPQLGQHIGPVVGMVGRLVRDKGFADVLNGAGAILADFPDTRFLLVGDGPRADELRDLARDQGIEDSVTFAGYCSNLEEIYRSLDILVLPSFVEGMPMVMLEAMAAGKPVIATRVGAIPTLIADGQNGLLVNPGDTAALVEALRKLLGDADLRKSMGKRGKELIERGYSARIMAQRYCGLYAHAQDLHRTEPVTKRLEEPIDIR